MKYIKAQHSGRVWSTMNGTRISKYIPIQCDDKGPSDEISAKIDRAENTVLIDCLANNGKVHFVYLRKSSPIRLQYMRYSGDTGKLEISHENIGGIESGDNFGFLTLDSQSGSMYLTVAHKGAGIAAVTSSDQGRTWTDVAKSIPEPLDEVWELSGCRLVTPDGYVVGLFSRYNRISKEKTVQLCMLKVC